MVYHMVHGLWFKPSNCASLQGCWTRCLERSRAIVAWGEAEKTWPRKGVVGPENDAFHGANYMIIWYNLSVGWVKNHWKPMDCVWIRGFGSLGSVAQLGKRLVECWNSRFEDLNIWVWVKLESLEDHGFESIFKYQVLTIQLLGYPMT